MRINHLISPQKPLLYVLIWLMFSLIPLVYLEIVRLFTGNPFDLPGLTTRWSFIIVCLILTRVSKTIPMETRKPLLLWSGLIVFCLGLTATSIYLITGSTLAAWVMLVVIFSVMLVVEDANLSQNRLQRWGWLLLGALIVGFGVEAVNQVEARFSEEEFFSAIQALVIASFWLLLRFTWNMSARFTNRFSDTPDLFNKWKKYTLFQKGLKINISLIQTTIIISAIIGAGFTFRSYQNSFYPPEAPAYPGISREQPFLCGNTIPSLQTYSGEQVFNDLLAGVAANSNKGVPELGMLALGTGNQTWAVDFRTAILQEARSGVFTGPSHSVKSAQKEASLRVYYYDKVRRSFPDLFLPTEQEELVNWFTAINRRVWTTEPIDWAYALAFSKPPSGPYENQENGAGILAALENTELADPALSPRNREYLELNPRGWLQRFRVTDDAIVYQPVWITNAFFQATFRRGVQRDNLLKSFEWLLIQAIPDGTPLRYNHLGAISNATVSYQGSFMTGDNRYLWLAGRALEHLKQTGSVLFAIPGVEKLIEGTGESPSTGSCLMYGDSGLPNQPTQFGPDKIVFRDGWQKESAYLLLNLRFTGWHRYKASNVITLVHQAGPLAVEELSNEGFSWLPVGRSMFRDKRIPRENLNGLAVSRSGVNAVLHNLTSLGGSWAQDPPHYAKVLEFSHGEELDFSSTVIEDWRGWTHQRDIYFFHNGPIVVIDNAEGPKPRAALLTWHVPEIHVKDENRYILRGGEFQAELVILPSTNVETWTADNSLNIQARGKLSVATIFLTRDWFGAEIIKTPAGIEIIKEGKKLTVPLINP